MLPPMAACLGCHHHEKQFAVRDCEGCHVDLPAERIRPESHVVHEGDFVREHGVRAASARDLCATCHSERFCSSCHGVTTPGLPARLAFDKPALGGLHRAGFKSRHKEEARGQPGLCTTCHSEDSCRACHSRENVGATGKPGRSPHPRTLAHRRQGRRRSRDVGAHRSRVVRVVPRRRRRAALRQLSQGRRRRRKHPRAGLLEHQEQDARRALSPVPRAESMTSPRREPSSSVAALALVGAAVCVRDVAVRRRARRAEGPRERAAHVGERARQRRAHEAPRLEEAERRVSRLPRRVGRQVRGARRGRVHEVSRAAAEAHARREARAPITRPASSCHAFGAKPAPTCISCHAEPQGKLAAVGVHATKDAPCTSCHMPHRDPQVKQADCAKCHTKVSASHGKQHVASDVTLARGWLDAGVGLVAKPNSPAPAGAPSCTDCHAPHTKAVAATTTCNGCHAAAPKGPQPSNHAACTTCHAPHDFERAAVAPCAGCHTDKRQRHREPRARRVHDVPRPAQCARAEGRLHDLSLHEAHARRGEGREARRLHVVPLAARSQGVTRGGVRDVSRQHQREARARQVGPMHRLPRAASEGRHAGTPRIDARRAGKSCDRSRLLELPHAGEVRHGASTPRASRAPPATSLTRSRWRSRTRRFCQKCHAAEQRLVATNKGHTDCMQCHARPALADAAEGDVRDVPQGRGDDRERRATAPATCATSLTPAKIVPAAAACKSCHAKEGASAHATRQRRQQRERERLLHDVPPAARAERRPRRRPPCATCHSPGSLPSLHRVGAGRDGGVARPTATRTRELPDLSLGARSREGRARRPRDVHDVPREQEGPPARGQGLLGLSRLPEVTAAQVA